MYSCKRESFLTVIELLHSHPYETIIVCLISYRQQKTQNFTLLQEILQNSSAEDN